MTDAVIVAHGLWMPGWETGILRRRLRSAGFEPHLFRFRTVRASLTENVDRLERFSRAVEGERVHYVGYSLGGVVVVDMLATRRPARPGSAVCLAAPLTGARAGEGLARTALGRRVLGRSVLELLRRGGLAPWTGECPLGLIAGNASLGAGRFFGSLPRPNDGTVTVAETQLEGADDHLVLRVTHSSIMYSRVVFEQIVHFLRHGRFAR
jgi:pimeloyl-ACP methyl ester carboxylesterase